MFGTLPGLLSFPHAKFIAFEGDVFKSIDVHN